MGDLAELHDPATRERSVTIKNELVRRIQRMKLSEKRLLALAIAKCNPKAKILKDRAMRPDPMTGEAPGWTIRVTAKEFIEAYPHIEAKHAYSELKEAAENLFECRVEWDEEVIERGKKTMKHRVARWIYEKVDTTTAGWVDLKFSPSIAPYLLGIESEFTKYKLRHAADLRSIYSWRLLEIMAQYRDKGFVSIGYDEFCQAMGAPDSCVKDSGQLRRRVIEPAVKELQEKNSLAIEWEPVKPSGRKVTGFRFKFKPDPQGRLF
ncbi:replication initiation protein [Burkholderia cenocepacia]|uniref:replication initiation protein n=1 Tax=Burkholderia cenocepacia TaxID=95486 RepID=UPI001B92FB84|nr:replication initiation protein [Burkholderia cenocepacia]MBR8029919.1 replication initiation protein [Burkholderia cenocepacia]MBR8173711.1 replication initiation protein [Burkholderia cenocepacia]